MRNRLSALDIAGYISLVITAVVEAVRQVPWVEALVMMAPAAVRAAIGFLPICLFTLVALLYLWRFFRGDAAFRAVVDILTPLNGDPVPWKRTVSGSIFPVGRPVQLLVFSGDGHWHPQPLPVVDGKLWTAECHFGTAEAADHASFEVVAISNSVLVKGPVVALPRRVAKSGVVRVTRQQ